MAKKLSPNIKILDSAGKDYLPSLSTIHSRAFHPIHPYHKRICPDTPLVRAWWSTIFNDYIESEYSYVLTAVDTTKSDFVAGVLLLAYCDFDAKTSNVFMKAGMTDDHDRAAFAAMTGGHAHERLMKGNSHLVIELFGVDHDYAGQGVGQALLGRACELAAGGGYDCFVQANAKAAKFYEKQGFEVRESSVMPGEEMYVECQMVRQAPANLHKE
ncbi:hypothetical protein LTR78_006601 [Recurvomyces mirabilis]|uniref:N-acetyltransferase domain-containing protein n=1 Tax=Recurvomyces mirabilis TaxID=574656 RepID=A0AAE0WKI2_9PEZI|nr:hypothetical protein LTR78_006601 [Recurvomyces mirabilis]KAK5149429.1 hypothetical protein LTS14_010949 [Recurvomyces mirabilis]